VREESNRDMRRERACGDEMVWRVGKETHGPLSQGFRVANPASVNATIPTCPGHDPQRLVRRPPMQH